MRWKVEGTKLDFWVIQPKLRKILCDLDYFCLKEFKKDICITSLIRKDNKKSVHAYGRGADIRSWDFTLDEIDAILEYVTRLYPYGKKDREPIIYHDAGSGAHLHIQVINDAKVE